MTKVKFENKEILASAWKMVKKKFWFLTAVVSLSMVATMVPSFTAEFLKKDHLVLSNIFLVVSYVIQFIVGMGMMRIALRLIDNGKPKLDELFSCARLFPRYFTATVGYFLIMMSGIIIFGLVSLFLPSAWRGFFILGGFFIWVIPAIILSLRYGMYPYLIVDKGAKAIESLKLSARLTEGNKYKIMIFGFWISLFVMGTFITLALVIGVPCAVFSLVAAGKLWVVSKLLRIASALLAVALVIIGLCVFVAGMCLASVLMMMTYAFLYRKLLGQEGV